MVSGLSYTEAFDGGGEVAAAREHRDGVEPVGETQCRGYDDRVFSALGEDAIEHRVDEGGWFWPMRKHANRAVGALVTGHRGFLGPE